MFAVMKKFQINNYDFDIFAFPTLKFFNILDF